MRRNLTTLTFVLAASLVFAGCGRARYPSYYTLNLPPAPDRIADKTAPDSIAVREFQSPSYLRHGSIVYRATPEQIGFYEYHRWASDPGILVTSAVVDHLRAGGRFSTVATYDGHGDTDYIFSGKLEKLEEVDTDKGVKVAVVISAQITRAKSGATVWSDTVSEVANVPQHNIPGIVSQMNQTMDVAIQKLLSTVPDAPLSISINR